MEGSDDKDSTEKQLATMEGERHRVIDVIDGTRRYLQGSVCAAQSDSPFCCVGFVWHENSRTRSQKLQEAAPSL